MVEWCEEKTKARFRIGVSSLCWPIWNFRNNLVFNKVQTTHFLQVFYMANTWIIEWAYVLSPDQRYFMASGCRRLLTSIGILSNLLALVFFETRQNLCLLYRYRRSKGKYTAEAEKTKRHEESPLGGEIS